jgi:hypothetical protein
MRQCPLAPVAARARRRGHRKKRREFIRLLGGSAVAWPLAARAQQPALPVVGFLRSTPAAGFEYLVNALRQGLNDAGFVEGRNVAVEYRWAGNQPDRLLGLAADLVSRQVAAIVASGPGVPRALRRLKKISGASHRGSLTFFNNFAVLSSSAKT